MRSEMGTAAGPVVPGAAAAPGRQSSGWLEGFDAALGVAVEAGTGSDAEHLDAADLDDVGTESIPIIVDPQAVAPAAPPEWSVWLALSHPLPVVDDPSESLVPGDAATTVADEAPVSSAVLKAESTFSAVAQHLVSPQGASSCSQAPGPSGWQTNSADEAQLADAAPAAAPGDNVPAAHSGTNADDETHASIAARSHAETTANRGVTQSRPAFAHDDVANPVSTGTAQAIAVPEPGPVVNVPPARGPQTAAGHERVARTVDAMVEPATSNIDIAGALAVEQPGSSSDAPGGHAGANANGSPAQDGPTGKTPAVAVIHASDGTFRLGPLSGAAPPAPLASSLNAREQVENIDRLVQAMRVIVRDGISEATVRLRPEHLGEVSIAVRVEGRTVSATVHAESAEVREWLHLQEDTLRSALQGQGLSLERLVVQRDGRQDRREPPPEQRRFRARRDESSTERFEVAG